MLQLIGQCGPLVGIRLYPDIDAPLYERGMGVCAGAMVIVAALSVVLRWYLNFLNMKNGSEETRGVYGELGGVEGGEDNGFVARESKGRRGGERFVYML